MKFTDAIELVYELADQGRLDESFTDVVASDLSELAVHQRDSVKGFAIFMTERHEIILDRYAGSIARIESTPPDTLCDTSTGDLDQVDAGDLGSMISTTIDLAHQQIGNVEEVNNPATYREMLHAIKMVSQFWIENGAEIASGALAYDAGEDSPEPF